QRLTGSEAHRWRPVHFAPLALCAFKPAVLAVQPCSSTACVAVLSPVGTSMAIRPTTVPTTMSHRIEYGHGKAAGPRHSGPHACHAGAVGAGHGGHRGADLFPLRQGVRRGD